MGNPPHSLLLRYIPAMAAMLDRLGHIFPFISPGTEMDVGQAVQPGETPPCAAQNTCPAVRRHLQSLPGQGGAPSLCITLSPTCCLTGPRRKEMRSNLGTCIHWEICRPKLHFLPRNQITSCWHGGKQTINILVWILSARRPHLWVFSHEGNKCDTPTSACPQCLESTSII